MYTIIKKCGSIFYSSLSIFVEDQNEECPLTKFEQLFMCSFAEICRQHWSKEKIINLLGNLKGRENLDTVKPIYCNLHHNWTIVVTEWLVKHYFSSFYGHYWIDNFFYREWCYRTQRTPQLKPLHFYVKHKFFNQYYIFRIVIRLP